LNGMAMHYTSNAMHAICACYIAALELDSIRKALKTFELSYENTPGRLNIHKNGGITAIMDFAHNPESLRELVELSEKFPSTGKRLIAISCSALSSDELIRETARQAAGKFDHYICKNFKECPVRLASEVPLLLKEGLVAGGVDPSSISTFEDPMQGVVALIDMARQGDVVILTTGRVHRDEHWKYLIEKI
ncbi:MAG TPA: cyanophycin synthetase, partial [Cellvibrionaceae bacterium]